MQLSLSKILGLVAILVAAVTLSACGGLLPKTSSLRAQQSLKQSTVSKLAGIGSSPGEAMMIRLFKQSSELEVWKRTKSGQFKLFETYQVCAYSGVLGPKVAEGDRQAPEGFYNITPGLMNPRSNYYLAFNTGFPNKFDRAWARTGSELMVHGDCSSRGCYSMTDEGIAEIYALARESFAGGNAVVQMQIFPFRMTPKNLAQNSANPNLPFWQDIKEGYDRFELSKTPPSWDVCEKKYVFDLKSPDGTPLDPVATCPARSGDTLLAAVTAKAAADDAQYRIEVAAIADRDAKAAAKKQAEADAEAAAKARGQAVGGFISGLFGGGSAQASEPPASDPVKIAPTPFPAPSWV
ncbi:MAG: murein L,D-transpeptidase [Devosia nanyangense]|uniref:Murein L,D-transpeptidase n=1 Tax=Devosia nanyangense TaxID=1228055 RepID=A0A933P027_9HYPH|nr:murein L,D-transpeptidase [Devosia nanyangense]